MADALNLFAGSRVRLRAVEAFDAEAFRDADLDSEAQRSGYRIVPARSEIAAMRWAEREAVEDGARDDRRFAVETLDGTLVGSIVAVLCDPRNGTFRYGIVIFRPHWRRGYAREAILLLLRYYFGELRYQKANSDAYAFNAPSLALHRALGFTEEGRVRRAYFSGGAYHDEIHFGITAEEFAAAHPVFDPAGWQH